MSFTNLTILRHGLMLRHHDIISDEVFQQRWNNVRVMMRDNGVESLLVYSDPLCDGMVCYLTNYPCYSYMRQALVVLSPDDGPFLYTSEPGRNLPRVRQFICCEVEKERQFSLAACKKALALTGNGTIGVVGKKNMPADLVRVLDDTLGASRVKDLSDRFYTMIALKDESGLVVTRKAMEYVWKVVNDYSKKVCAGQFLYRLQSDIDYNLRLAGCEDTNILTGAALTGRVRPGIPDRSRQLQEGERLLIYVGAQYARLWGAAGVSVTVGKHGAEYSPEVESLRQLQDHLATQVVSGMKLGEFRNLIIKLAEQRGLTLARDLPMVQGIGYTMAEYPLDQADIIQSNTVLQIVLAVDGETESSGFVTDLLQVTDNGGIWLGKR